MAKPVGEWTIRETYEWVGGLFLDEDDDPAVPMEVFRKNKIVGRVLLKLDMDHLREMGIPEYGVRLRIIMAIQELTATDPSQMPLPMYLHPIIGTTQSTTTQSNLPKSETDAYAGYSPLHTVPAQAFPMNKLSSPPYEKAHNDSEDTDSEVISESISDTDTNSNRRYLAKKEIAEAVKQEMDKMITSWNETKLPLLKAKSHRLYSARASAPQKRAELGHIEKRVQKIQDAIVKSAPLTLLEVKNMSRGLEISLQNQLEFQWLLDLYDGPKPPPPETPVVRPAPTTSKPRIRAPKLTEDEMDDFIEYDGEEGPALRELLTDDFEHQQAEETATTNVFKPSFNKITYKGQFGLSWQNTLDLIQRSGPSAILKKLKHLMIRRAASPQLHMSSEDASLIFVWEEYLLHYQNNSRPHVIKQAMPNLKLFAQFCTLASARFTKPDLKPQHKFSNNPPVESVKSALSIQQDDRSKESNILPLSSTNTSPKQHEEIMVSRNIGLPSFCTFLKPHQIDGIRFLWRNLIIKNNGCILAHSMGLGKTLQVIIFICTLIQTCRTAPDTLPQHLRDPSILILCPISVRANWQLEFKKWIPSNYLVDFSISVIGETGLDRLYQKALEIRRWASAGGILIMNYDTWRVLSESDGLMEDGDCELSLQECLLDPGPSLVICDEGHIIKNPGSKISTLVKRIATPSKICLTGYPIQNNLMEYWCMVDFVYPGYLGPEATFEEYFCKPITDALYFNCNSHTQQIAQLRLYILSVVLESIVARKDSAILTEGLPHKVEITISCKLSPLQERLYKEIVSWFTAAYHVREMNFFGKGHVLSDICNHPLTLKVSPTLHPSLHYQARTNKLQSDAPTDCANNEGGVIPSDNSPNLMKILKSYKLEEYSIQDTSLSSKFKVLIAIMKETVKRKEKMLIFTRSLAVLDVIDNYIQCNPDFGFAHFRLDGSVLAQDRQAMLEAFNSSTTHNIFTISTMAGSLGVNLVSASRVVLYDVDWNPSHSSQAIARVFRYGQEKETFVYRLYTHSTFEESLMKCSAVKSALFSRVVDQFDAPSNHSKLHKRYFKIPEPAPPFEAPLNIHDEVALAVASSCGNELVKMELLDRYYDVIEFGISEAIKAKARNSILIGQHMDKIQSPVDSPPMQTNSPYAPSESDSGESASEVICASPFKRLKGQDTAPIQVDSAPEYAISTPRVTRDNTHSVSPTGTFAGDVADPDNEPRVPDAKYEAPLITPVEGSIVTTTDDTPKGIIPDSPIQATSIDPSQQGCESPQRVYSLNSTDEDCKDPPEKLPALKPIGACLRRVLVPPRDQSSAMDPNPRTHYIPQVAKGKRSPKSGPGTNPSMDNVAYQEDGNVASIDNISRNIKTILNEVSSFRGQGRKAKKTGSTIQYDHLKWFNPDTKQPNVPSKKKRTFEHDSSRNFYKPNAPASKQLDRFSGGYHGQNKPPPNRNPNEYHRKLSRQAVDYRPYPNTNNRKTAPGANTVAKGAHERTASVAHGPRMDGGERDVPNPHVSEHPLPKGTTSRFGGSLERSGDRSNSRFSGKKNKNRQAKHNSQEPRNRSHEEASCSLSTSKINQNMANPGPTSSRW
ncbi:hypothetical protein DSO57_1021687 [Entomophthora muscae]|uniref:Uncharacterized protein n=1 Tax=Entomophthora muscae TaxID=34485 RepID=A0ACC2SSL0_9FUNG|nr:hypothetical protein DSO57_1021687 [Entomophthora muscae]